MQSLWGMGQLWKIMTSWIIQWESNEERYKVDEGWANLEKSLHGQWSNDSLIKKINVLVWTYNRGGATMQTSPCCMFRLPIPYCLTTHNPDRVHGGCRQNVNKANSVYRQKIFVPSNFGYYFSCYWARLDGCLKREGDQWFRIPTRHFLKYNSPNKVRGERTRAVNTSNSDCTWKIIDAADACGASYDWWLSG